MKATTLHAVDAINGNKTLLEKLADAMPAEPGVVKTLDSKFESFGDALFTWTNSLGFEEQKSKCPDTVMVRSFCAALGHPFVGVNTDYLLSQSQYFESDTWFFKHVEEKGYIRHGNGDFFLLDDGNRPIARLQISTAHHTNVSISYAGAEHLMNEFRELLLANLKTDETTEKKSTYAEVILEKSMMGGEHHRTISGKIDNKRVALPEYYPYLDGGIEALLKDFVESEESVLILKGPPGTGKSSAVASAVEALNLLPIYAKRADAVMHKDFISFVFKCSDGYMENVAGTSAKARNDLFAETLVKDREFMHNQNFHKREEEEAPRVPIIVVEDADLLLTPRSSGNVLMSELLNETDGIGSNHTRKIIFTTNLGHTSDIDEALMRPGRCYGVINMRLLTADEAIAARAAAGLPEFEVKPTKDVSLAEALRKPRKRIVLSNGKAGLGFRD